MVQGIDYRDLQEIIKELQMENKRLTEENLKYKERYDVGITSEEMEEMYKNYYEQDVIHIAN